VTKDEAMVKLSDSVTDLLDSNTLTLEEVEEAVEMGIENHGDGTPHVGGGPKKASRA
jgi:hypothetical protein